MPKFVYFGDDVLICNEHNRVVGIYHPLEPLPQTRHQTNTMPRTRHYPSTVEYLQEREQQRYMRASTSPKIN